MLLLNSYHLEMSLNAETAATIKLAEFNNNLIKFDQF